MNFKKIFIIIVLIILGISAGLYRFRQNNKPLPFVTMQPEVRNLVQYVNCAGKLKAEDQITVGSLIAGRVIKILANDNDVVKKGDLLAVLDNGIGDTAKERAKAVMNEIKAKLDYTKDFYDKEKQLYELDQISKDKFETVTRDYQVLQAQYEQAKADFTLKQKEYDNLFIKAPDNGIIISKNIDLGQMVTSVLQATQLFIIAKDLKSMEIEVEVDEADIGLIKPQQKAIFTVDAFPNKKFTGTIKELHYLPQIIENVVTYAAIIKIKNDDLILRPGMTADINIEIAKSDNAVCVLNKAFRISELTLEKVANKLKYGFKPLDNIEKNSSLWILKNKIFKEIPVQIGPTDNKYTEVINLSKSLEIVKEVVDPDSENALVKQMFSNKSGIGK